MGREEKVLNRSRCGPPRLVAGGIRPDARQCRREAGVTGRQGNCPDRPERRPSGLIGHRRDSDYLEFPFSALDAGRLLTPNGRFYVRIHFEVPRLEGKSRRLIVEGEGEAIVEGQRVMRREGMLVLIRRGETHEIRNTGRGPLKALNVYVPPA